jgi:hypothetical protein
MHTAFIFRELDNIKDIELIEKVLVQPLYSMQ